MNLNKKVFEKVLQKNAKILVVTKYYDKAKTELLIEECEQNYSSIIFGFGENRVKALEEKKLSRAYVHFIGNLQSKKLRKIIKYCSTIHSLDSLKHAEKMNKILDENSSNLGVFIQIKLDKSKPNGILLSDLANFLQKMKKFKNIEILGISGMGKLSVDQTVGQTCNKKIGNKKDFQFLVKLRDKYLPQKLISAGTSQDYEVALEEGIEVVRVGRGVIL